MLDKDFPDSITNDAAIVHVTPPAPSDTEDLPSDSVTPPLATLYTSISQSIDKLFFVCYTPADTMRPRWYLVQVHLNDSPLGETTGVYFCSFFQRHPSDAGKSDSSSRW